MKVVDGFIDVWKINNVTSGKFTSSSVLMNFSNGQKADLTASINIL